MTRTPTPGVHANYTKSHSHYMRRGKFQDLVRWQIETLLQSGRFVTLAERLRLLGYLTPHTGRGVNAGLKMHHAAGVKMHHL